MAPVPESRKRLGCVIAALAVAAVILSTMCGVVVGTLMAARSGAGASGANWRDSRVDLVLSCDGIAVQAVVAGQSRVPSSVHVLSASGSVSNGSLIASVRYVRQ